MNITALIAELERIRREEGDLEVCVAQPHEHWGTVHDRLEGHNIAVENAQPDGPKSGRSERAVVIAANC